jgi:hypothetical protein
MVRRIGALAMGLALVVACGGADETADMEGADAAAEAAAAEAPAADAGDMSADPTLAPEGAATGLPAGYQLRLDRPNQNQADFHVMEMGGGRHITTGPAAIFFDPSQTVASGNYTVSATFVENKPRAQHREAYGFFIGGADLQSESQRYTYFLIRGDGQYLIKQRNGSETPEVTSGWQSSPAIQASETGEMTNQLTVRLEGDQIHFMANGQELTTVPAADLPTHGIIGLRVNHNLDVQVRDWQVQQN